MKNKLCKFHKITGKSAAEDGICKECNSINKKYKPAIRRKIDGFGPGYVNHNVQ